MTSAKPGRNTPLLSLFSADAISITGNAMGLLAIPWFVLQTTGSPAKTGIIAAANLLPTVIASLFGGVLVDRFGKKGLSIVADLTSGITIALIPLLYMSVGLEFWQLLLLVFLGALLDAPGVTARHAMLPDISRDAGWSLERATGWTAVIHRSGQMAGAPLAGLLIAGLGALGVLWVNAATFAVSSVIVALGIPSTGNGGSTGNARLWADLREGWGFLANDPVLRTIALTVAITNLLDSASSVIMPVFAEVVFDSALALGLIVGALGGGAVIGALIYARFGHRFSRRSLYLWCFLGVTLWYPAFAMFPPLFIAVAIRGISGIAAGPLNPLIDTAAFERIPAEFRGRVLGSIRAVAWMTMPLGPLFGAALLEGLRLRSTLLVVGAIYATTVVLLRFSRGIRDLDISRPLPDPD